MRETPLLYGDLASLWAIFSPPADYVEEAATFRRRLLRHGIRDGATLLHLGSGGGSVDSNLKQWYRVTGVDVSAGMIRHAVELNPEVAYVAGDMRSIRLGCTFDAVLVHDAISYMTSVAELDAVYRTAAAHLEAGGVMLAIPEELKHRLAALEPSVVTRRSGELALTVIETHYDDDVDDNVFEGVYVFLIRRDGRLDVHVDRHTVGVFELDEFLDSIRRAGFAAEAEPWELSDWGDSPELPLIVAVKE